MEPVLMTNSWLAATDPVIPSAGITGHSCVAVAKNKGKGEAAGAFKKLLELRHGAKQSAESMGRWTGEEQLSCSCFVVLIKNRLLGIPGAKPGTFKYKT